MIKNATAIWLIPLWLASGIADAQTHSPEVQKSAPPRSVLPAFTSVFDNYKPYSDDKSLDWKEANRQVQRRGGWRQYAKEAQEPEQKPDPSTTGASPAAERGATKPKP